MTVPSSHSQLVIPLNRIKSVTKEKRALLFPTAIHVTTATDKYGFSSFIQRDVSYQILFRLWQNALLNQVCGCVGVWLSVCVCVCGWVGVCIRVRYPVPLIVSVAPLPSRALQNSKKELGRPTHLQHRR